MMVVMVTLNFNVNRDAEADMGVFPICIGLIFIDPEIVNMVRDVWVPWALFELSKVEYGD